MVLNGTLKWKDASAREALVFDSLQANVLKGHGRKHLRLIHLHFEGRDAALELIEDLATKVTTAADQLAQADNRKSAQRLGRPLLSLLLTASGLTALKIEMTDVCKAFRDGMQLDDEAVQFPYRYVKAPAYQIHGSLLLASGNDAADSRQIEQLEKALYSIIYKRRPNVAGARILGRERGMVLESAGFSREHFGYPDGRSQVLILKDDADEELRTLGPDRRWNPVLPASRAVVQVEWRDAPDPAPTRVGFGSYFVFQKLEQNVRLFKATVAREAARTSDLALTRLARSRDARNGVDPGKAETARDVVELDARANQQRAEAAARVGARMLGRFEDGTSLAQSQTPRRPKAIPNNFNYEEFKAAPPPWDLPASAHIRAANPRKPEETDPALFPRRGIPYDERPAEERRLRPTPGQAGYLGHIGDLPDKGVGLLFIGYNSDIEGQFQAALLRVRGGADGNRGDALMGADAVGAGVDDEGKPIDVPFVRLKGGGYFLAPPVEYLLNIQQFAGSAITVRAF
jgi:deferrochelatase/peroxidase EfeB